ncbi:MAG: FAD-binding domain, partial [Bdellovibrionales bacterium]|nr:FAD-binding domain [Bdellovibrionales bacterium]
PVLLEKAPELRTGGYIIDFWGAGFDIAEKMGILPQLNKAGYKVEDIKLVDDEGKRTGGFSAKVFDSATGGRYLSLARSELAAAIYHALNGQVETRFATSIKALHQQTSGVQVEFDNGTTEKFDLVVGADGLHSNVRQLVFGNSSKYERYLGYKVAAFEAAGYPIREDLSYVMFTKVGKQVSRFTMRDDKTLFLFIFAEDSSAPETTPHDLASQKLILEREFSGAGWECPEILKALSRTESLYFDRVSQIRMPDWTKGRIALVGDAAFCPSLLSGQGTALAMIGAYMLAYQLEQFAGSPSKAFAAYEQALRTFMDKKQKAAEQFSGAFAPKTAFGLFFRNQITKLFSVPFIADMAMGSGLRDAIELPEFQAA